MQKNPHMLIEGIVITTYAVGDHTAFIYIRGEYALQADILEAAIAEAQARGLLGERILDSELLAQARPAPRRGRLHLRRGDRPAGLAGGQARKPAPEAAVPRDRGPVPRPHADQQRRDPVHDPDDHAAWAARSTRRSAPRRRPGPSSSRCRETCSARATTRSSWGSRRGRSSSTWPGARRGTRDQVLVPGRLELADPDRRRPRPGLRLRHDGEGGLDARVRRDHRRRRQPHGARGRDEARQVLRPRVLRQVRPVPRGHQLDREDAAADRVRRGHPDGPRHHGLGAGRRSSATACACSATRWRCRSGR